MQKSFIDYGIDVSNTSGEEVKTTCPKCSSSRKKRHVKCLNVNTVKQVWNCWHCGWSGGLKDGIKNKSSYIRIETKPINLNMKELSEPMLNFFLKRGISKKTLQLNDIHTDKMYMPQTGKEENCIVFPYIKDGTHINAKYRDNKKNFRQVKGAEKIVFNYDAIDKTTIIVEGEMDALSIQESGLPNVISVPDGAPALNAKSFGNKFDYLNDPIFDKVEQFIIAVDNDDPGKRLLEELSRILGRSRCLITTWADECKDANDTLVKYGKDQVRECIVNAKPFPIEGAYSIEDIEDSLDYIYEHGYPKGDSTGWEVLDEFYTVRTGQWSLVTGMPNHGKSEWLDALIVNMSTNLGWKFAICSTENQPIQDHAMKLAEKIIGKRRHFMSRQDFESAKEVLRDHIHFILPKDISLTNIFDATKQLVRTNGIKGLVLDPFNEICKVYDPNGGMSGTEVVSEFLAKIRQFARENGIHIWLVAHPTKMYPDKDGKMRVPEAYDVAGSAHFANKSDAIISVYRENPKDITCATEIHIKKMRNSWLGKQGDCLLWWDKDSGRYNESPLEDNQPTLKAI